MGGLKTRLLTSGIEEAKVMFSRMSALLFFCLLLLILLPTATGQAQDSNDWQIPHIECGEGCTPKYKLDEQGNLYIYMEYSRPSYQGILYVVPRGTTQFVEYNIQQLYPITGFGRDFIPFANQTLLIFDYQAQNPFVLLDLQTEQAVPLIFNISGQVELCNISSIATNDPSFYRIGENGILFCSRTNNTSYIHLAHIQDDTLAIENTFDMGTAAKAEGQYLPPWRSIATSLNGNIYAVVQTRNQILHQIAPEYAQLYDHGKYYIVLR
ncbi:MAG TPA: hypothetical protein VHP83_27650 [Aggregatilineaceae bacterium]|nr:hypothetical protein [Aggregatilineaceae bacterium]